MPKTVDCVKCGGRMEVGFILDFAHNEIVRSHWVAGEAEQLRILGFLPAFRLTFAAAAAVCALAALVALLPGRERGPRATSHEA